MIEASRYPFAPRVDGLAQGTRGNGSQGYAWRMWGVTADEYMRIADPWPLNPDGELLFGLKIENPRADSNVESSVRVPGIAFAEWGPGDHGFLPHGATGHLHRRRRSGAAHGGGAASRAQCHQGGRHQVPEFVQRKQRDRPATRKAS